MTNDEYTKILAYVQENKSSEVQADFSARVKHHDRFRLYDQQERCGFLDERDLCELHDKQLKPVECFSWPFHLYTAPDGASIDIRYSTSCCSAHLAIEEHPEEAQQYAERILAKYKPDEILSFRQEYGGSYENEYLSVWEYME